MYITSVQKEKSNTKPKIKIINISLLYNKNLRHIYSNFCLLYLLYKISAGTDESQFPQENYNTSEMSYYN